MILNYDSINKIKPVSKNNKSKIEQIIKEVEDFEIEQLLGDALFQDVVNNYVDITINTAHTHDIWNDLVDGCAFTNKEGKILKHNGLKNIITYLVYAEYVIEASISDTFSGIVEKTRTDSQQVSRATLENLRNKNREIGFNYYKLTREFLEINKDIYTNFNICKEKRVNNFNVTSITTSLKKKNNYYGR